MAQDPDNLLIGDARRAMDRAERRQALVEAALDDHFRQFMDALRKGPATRIADPSIFPHQRQLGEVVHTLLDTNVGHDFVGLMLMGMRDASQGLPLQCSLLLKQLANRYAHACVDQLRNQGEFSDGGL